MKVREAYMLKKLSGVFFLLLIISSCGASYVGMPEVSLEGAGAGQISLYQLKTIGQTEDCEPSKARATATNCTARMEVFQLVEDQALAKNITGQTTTALCPNDAVISANRVYLSKSASQTTLITKERTVNTGATAESLLYFLLLDSARATGMIVDKDHKVLCKMSFARADLDKSVTPKKESLVPEGSYDSAIYTFNIQELSLSELSPHSYKIFSNKGLLDSQIRDAQSQQQEQLQLLEAPTLP